jgi:PKD repeat protein
MKLFFSCLAALMLLAGGAQAQDLKPCYTTEQYYKALAAKPEIAAARTQLQHFTEQYLTNHAQHHGGAQVYVIPVVFHIIHNYGRENISDAQVLDCIDVMNNDFRKRSADTVDIVPQFQSIAADCEIEFRLATIDPNGNCTNGIDRIASLLTYNADDDAKLNPWPSDQYLNVWVVHDLGSSGAAAYAYYPGTAPPGKDGVIAIHSYVGSIGTSSLGTARVLTHEMGHCLNLSHVWGDTNNPGVSCGDDWVNDTPISEGWTGCNLSGANCGGGIENVQNYMEYSYCFRMFTQGQGLRMQAALNSPFGDRNNLWTPANLSATGVANPSGIPCAPIADFAINTRYTCVNDTLVFTDLSWNGNPTQWNWNFLGAQPSTSTDSVVKVVYNNAGVYAVSLQVTNATGSDSIVKNDYVYVTGSTLQSLPFTEDFELPNSFPGVESFVINNDNGNTWASVSNASYSGSSSIRINNFTGNATGQVDEYFIRNFDFTGITQPTLTFRLAAAIRDTLRKDKLEVLVSRDCGRTWQLRYLRTGTSLNTRSGFTTSNYTPNNSTDWRLETVSLNPYAGAPNVKIKFKNTSARGNNIYIDDINVNGIPLSVSNEVTANGFSIIPNPSTSAALIQLPNTTVAKTLITICDVSGRLVWQKEIMDSKQAELPIVEQGLYLVTCTQNDKRLQQKWIVQ